jgi:hypothetical protein
MQGRQYWLCGMPMNVIQCYASERGSAEQAFISGDSSDF